MPSSAATSGGKRLAGKPADAVEPLAGLSRLVRRQIVEADAGMRVDDPERRVLALEVFDDARQHDVLDDVGEIPGVIGVPVVHENASLPRKRTHCGIEQRGPLQRCEMADFRQDDQLGTRNAAGQEFGMFELDELFMFSPCTIATGTRISARSSAE